MYKNITCLFILIAASLKIFAQGNDDCSNAIPITLTPFGGGACTATIHATTAGATQSLPNPLCTSVENDDDIWYTFVPTTQSVLLRFSNVVNDATGGPAYVGFGLYAAGCPLNTGTDICNNLVSAGSHFLIINGLIIGNTYHLRFWSTLTFGASASFDFCLQEVPAPPNDECANATVITSEPVGTICNAAYHASTIGASPAADRPTCTNGFDDDDIWYTFTAHTSGVRLNFSNTKVETELSGGSNVGYAIYETACPGSAEPVSCNPNIGINSGSALIGGLVPGHQYYLSLFSYDRNRYMSMDFCLVDVDLPLNDECRNATALTVGNGFCTNAVTGDLTNGTASAGFGPPACSPLSSSEDVWFKTTVPASGNVVIQTSAVNTQINDLVMETYSGNCGALTLITCDDNSNPDPVPSEQHARISLTGRIPGETVFLRVLGKGTINWGRFAICAWDSTVLISVSPGGDCIPGNTVTIDPANDNQYRWIPVFDASGKIITEIFGNGNALEEVNTSLFVNSSGTVRNVAGLYYLDRNMNITTSGAGGAKLRFYFTEGEWAALQLAQPAISLPALKIDKTATACQPAFSGTNTVINQDAVTRYGNDYFMEFSTPSFSSFYIDGNNTALPLRFVSFTGENRSGKAALQWIVLKDEDIRSFEVQRMNAAGEYNTIAQVKQSQIAAVVNGAWQYVFDDNIIINGNSFYRIKMNTYSGAVLYSSVVTMRLQGNAVSVAPNPVQDYITVTGSPGIENIKLINTAGVVLKQYRRPVTQNGIVLLDVHGMPGGVYIVQVQQGSGGIQSFKIMKY